MWTNTDYELAEIADALNLEKEIEDITTQDFGKCLGYSEKPCVNCGRLRVERYENGKEVCEKCGWEQNERGYFFNAK